MAKGPAFVLLLKQVKKHIKQGQGHEGGIFSVEAPLHVSNVQVVDPATGYGLSDSQQNLLVLSSTIFLLH